MSKENDRISGNIACIDTLRMPATLISTIGHHCEVWRSTGVIVQGDERVPLDVVIKRHREPCSLKEIQIFNKEYRELKRKLEEIVPTALFVSTQIDGVANVIVIAEAVTSWFNIANPANEQETIPLLRQLPKASSQLQRFIRAAKSWYEGKDTKVIDLYGIDNLILDVNREIKYVDSFCVFFYEDLLYVIDEIDAALQEKITLSLQRRDYLEYVLKESRLVRVSNVRF